MDQCRCRNLTAVFEELGRSASWNSSPSKAVEVIARLEPFYTELLKLCRNGVIPRKRLVNALINLDTRATPGGERLTQWNAATPCQSLRPIEEAAEELSKTIRVGASKLRDLKRHPKAYYVAVHGASDDCARIIDRLLDSMTFENSPVTSAALVTRQFEILDDTGCCMEIFCKVLRGDMTRPLQHDSSTESLVATPALDTAPTPGRAFLTPTKSIASHEWPMSSMKETAESCPPTPTTTAGSTDLPTSNVFSSPAAHVATNLSEPSGVSETVRQRRSRRAHLTKPSGASRTPTKAIQLHQGAAPYMKETKEKKNFMSRAYRVAYKASNARGFDEASSRAAAQKAYKAAGHRYVALN